MTGMINDQRVLPPQFMFALSGSLFIIASLLMNFVRVWKNDETQRQKEQLEHDNYRKSTSEERNQGIENDEEELVKEDAIV